ncbi:MAG: tRNA uridine-5-carboxymethylaminomethyl(34) synthesis GTPase MnmE [Pseudomonadota bacterium]
MPVSKTDTIAALATAPGRSGVAIVRISGDKAETIAQAITKTTLKPRYAHHLCFYDHDDTAIDEGLALFFPRPHSFTGENVLELHCHGGPIVVDRLLKRAIALGARSARPGEFSQRAFINDKLDLSQAEAIADLINATSEQAARSAIKSLQGEFSRRINLLVEQLIHLRLYVEAAIDFPEEEIDFLKDEHITTRLQGIIDSLHSVKASATQGRLLQEGMTAVIVGAPNAGKSSLLNCLSENETAIVSDIAGTTRDVLREYIHIDGMPLHIVDTAGLRESDNLVEREGIKRAKQAMEKADVILLVIDISDNQSIDISQLPENKAVMIIRNKIDLLNEKPKIVIDKAEQQVEIYLSATQQQGIDLLKQHLKEMMGFHDGEGVFIARRRHLDALQRAENSLLTGQQQLQQHQAGELLAEDLRQAQQALNEITGEFSSDDLLGKIFADFCIGK